MLFAPIPSRIFEHPEGGERAVVARELLRGTLLHDPPVLHDDDVVGFHRRRDAVSDGYDHTLALLELNAERSLERRLRRGIHGSGSLIEEKHRGIADEGTGEGQKLFLSGRELEPLSPSSVAYDRIVAGCKSR